MCLLNIEPQYSGLRDKKPTDISRDEEHLMLYMNNSMKSTRLFTLWLHTIIFIIRLHTPTSFNNRDLLVVDGVFYLSLF